jgi:hypothetical protein
VIERREVVAERCLVVGDIGIGFIVVADELLSARGQQAFETFWSSASWELSSLAHSDITATANGTCE